MTPSARIGCVPYLNAKPLIHGLNGVRLEVPSALARSLRAGELDVALVPVAEYLEHPHYRILPGMAIASRGPVQSVYLAHRKPLQDVQTIQPDPASRTSNLLLKVIMTSFLKKSPRYQTDSGADAKLLIGDPALQQRGQLLHEGWQLFDLGEAWHRFTGLPFVYAFWAMRPDVKNTPCIEILTDARRKGIENLESIASIQSILSPEAALSYLRHNISYDLAGEELEGFRKFQHLCVETGLIDRIADLRTSV